MSLIMVQQVIFSTALAVYLLQTQSPLILLQMFVIKSNKFNDKKMVNTLKAESDILARIPPHGNITIFLGAVLEEEQAKDGSLQHCRLMMELAEREL